MNMLRGENRRPRPPTPPPGDSAMMLASPAMGERERGGFRRGGEEELQVALNFSEADTALADRLLRLRNAEVLSSSTSRIRYAMGRGAFELIGGEYRCTVGGNGPGTFVCSINSGGGLDVDVGTFRADPVV